MHDSPLQIDYYVSKRKKFYCHFRVDFICRKIATTKRGLDVSKITADKQIL